MPNYETAESRDHSLPRPGILQTPGLISRAGMTGGYGNTALTSQLAGPEMGESAGGGAGFSRYVHALRRRWLVSLLIALPLAAGAAYGAWVLQPQMYTATFVLQIKQDADHLVFTTADQAKAGGGTTFDSFKRSQRVILRLRHLIDRALDPEQHTEMKKVPVLQREAPNEVDWIVQNLNVTFPDDSDIMAVSLTADDPKGLHEIVNNIVDEYYQEVVASERQKKLERYNTLDKTSKQAIRELVQRRGELKSFAERVGHGEKAALSIVQQNALEQYRTFMQRFESMRFELFQKETELDHRLELQDAKDIPIADGDVTAAMATDHVARYLESDKESLVRQIEKNRDALNPEKAAKTIAELNRKLESNADKYTARKEEVRKLLVDRTRLAAAADIDLLKQEVLHLKKQKERFETEGKLIDQKAKDAGKSSIEVEMMRSDIDVLQQIADNLKIESAKTRVELGLTDGKQTELDDDSWARIRKFNRAAPARAVDSKTRLATTIGVGGLSFFLPFALFVMLDASKNRISTGAEVTQAVGLSVIGAVPILPQRVIRRLNGPSENDKYWRTLLSESVDSIAAVLLRGTQPGTSRVIMVSSANAGEGKTTLAAHLAVSLAGAGRHPVLVDFDLRRPALHRVFGVSLQPGVNEILRDGHEFEAALQATQIPNLMMLSAGRTSKLGLGGLVGADLQSLFTKLRAEFDFVVVDACPILPVVDTRLIGQHVDAVLLSVLRDVSRAPKLRAACDLLDMFGIPMLGVVVTGSSEELYRDARYEPLSEAQAV